MLEDDAEDTIEAEIIQERSSEEDESLTLTQLGEHARMQLDLKTSGSMDFTAWQVFVLEMSDSVTVDHCKYLQQTNLCE